MDLELLIEAERRGILPADKQELLSEARRRGLVPGGAQPDANWQDSQPPEGMFMNPYTGQMTSRELLRGAMGDRGQGQAAIAGGAQGVTFGGIDELTGVIDALANAGRRPMGETYEFGRERARAALEGSREDYPKTFVGSEIAGAVAAPAGIAGGLGKGATTAERVVRGARSGGRMGATYGFLTGEGGAPERVESMAQGATLGAGTGGAIAGAGEALRKGAESVMQRGAIREAVNKAPTTEQLAEEGRKLYQQVDNAGIQIKPEAFGRLREDLRTTLRGQGLDELPGPGSLTPKSARVMQIADEMSGAMASEPSSALPFSSLDQLRRHAGTAAANMAPEGKTDRALGAEAISRIDDYVQNLGADDVVAGDVQALQTVLPKARETWARMSKSQLIDDAMEEAGNYQSGGASGIKNQFRRILNNKKLSRGFSDAEKKAMRNVVNGSLPDVILNYMGSGLGMMGQMGAGLGIGAATGLGPIPGALLGTAAAGASRKGAEAMARRKAEIARALVASPQTPNLPQVDMNKAKIIEALMRQGVVANQN